MSRLLHAPTVDGPTRRLDPPEPVLDQATRDLLVKVEAEAYERGRADGAAQAREAAVHAAEQAVAAVSAAVAEVRRDLSSMESERAGAVVELGRRLAESVLGRELQEGGTALVDRVLAAADALDHGPFVVHVAEVDATLLRAHLTALPPGTTVEVGPTLAPGEARITGPWSGVDLTRQTVLDVLLETGP